MHHLKFFMFIASFAYCSLSFAANNDDAEKNVITLPTIQVMAEDELSETTGFIPFQEDTAVRQALQHQIYKNENDIQNTTVKENTGNTIHYQPPVAQPDMTNFSPALQQHVLAIAEGLQSNDPTQGVFKMLDPLGIDRNKALESIPNRDIKINQNDLMILQQLLQNSIKGP